MATKFLANTALTSMIMNDKVYTYAQTYEGDLYEIQGHINTSGIFAFDKRRSNEIVIRYEAKVLMENAPKMFTPLAATSFTPRKYNKKNQRFLFFIDDKNMLRSVSHPDDAKPGEEWQKGTIEKLNIRCGHYSKLAAITVENDLYNFICVYYQDDSYAASIKMVSYTDSDGWSNEAPDLRDPPLYGTFLAAVQPRKGILVGTTEGSDAAKQPVYYLQMDDFRLGHAQGTSDPVVLSGLELDNKALVFSPQTSITTIDDGKRLYMIYKSSHNKIKLIEILDGKPKYPESFKDMDPTPMSCIAACLLSSSNTTQIMFFYQSLDIVTRQVYLISTVLSKNHDNPNEKWVLSEPAKLGH